MINVVRVRAFSCPVFRKSALKGERRKKGKKGKERKERKERKEVRRKWKAEGMGENKKDQGFSEKESVSCQARNAF